ncbi:hypothetical protein J6590_027574 [Homalodisca vitripennis]|nr:hypothetical protein J6590_027574 [Homalodisca vitripennis]
MPMSFVVYSLGLFNVCRDTLCVNACFVTLLILFYNSSTSTMQPELPSIENLVKEKTILQERIAEIKDQLRHVSMTMQTKTISYCCSKQSKYLLAQPIMTPRAWVVDFGVQ